MSLTFSDKIRKHTNVSSIQVCAYVNQQTHTLMYVFTFNILRNNIYFKKTYVL